MKFKKIWDNTTSAIEAVSVLFVSTVGVYIVYDQATDLFGLSTWGTFRSFLMFIALMFFIEFMFRLFMFILESIK